ncbi:hypothetical protein J3Q64DRAFT_1701235 [Phycomyces blakesleeanus]|uniref:F-box domain-containing protein n=1 Tax=Phycomyces blakesleeanus TaxID=4837 RepID=A0ABR3ASG7_PHYBL
MCAVNRRRVPNNGSLSKFIVSNSSLSQTLPPNILSFIATHVARMNQRTCVLVCKQWTEPFLNACWGKISVEKLKIKSMVDTSNLKRVYTINTHRVWALELATLNPEDMVYLSWLQQAYPKLKYFECMETRGQDSWITESIDWSLWKSLSYLSIHLDYSHEDDTVESFFLKLSEFSSLVHLTISPSYGDRKLDYILAPITKDDMEILYFSTLQNFGSTLEHIEFFNDGRSTYLVDDFKSCIQPFSETLKTLSIKTFDYPNSKPNTYIFSVCPELVELRIVSFSVLVEVDFISNQFFALRLLHVSSSPVSLTTSPKNTPAPHSTEIGNSWFKSRSNCL